MWDLVCYPNTKGSVGCLETERMGLLQLKSYLENLLSPQDERILKSWNDGSSNSDCCVWEGVNCSNAIGGHIVDLSLNKIMPIQYQLREAPSPLNLSLFHSFPQLIKLSFSYNGIDQLFDPIHGYQSLENLKNLDLSYNRLNNSVLPFVSAARSLRTLSLFSNRLESVSPPNGLMFLSSLQVLDLSANQLSLTPKGYSYICALKNLQELGLRSNALTSMPYCLGNLSRLRTLDLLYNQLNGNLSSFVSGLPPALEYLSLHRNYFNGLFLFSSLVNHTRLTLFKLSSEVGMLQAQAESSWVPLFQLKLLTLQNFILGSTIPRFLVHQRDLCYIDLSHNKLTGAVPAWLVENNTRLQTLLLNSNSLTKLQLPSLVHGLQALDISSNEIHDRIQENIGIVFPKLRSLIFALNHFHGTIPSSVGEMKSLETLDVSNNGLYGRLPKTFLSSCYSLMVLKLSNNQFQGSLGLLNSNNTMFLDISENRFSGTLPHWIGRMSSLVHLNMSRNQLKGPFPRHLQNLPWLQVIDISHNSFSGAIPSKTDFPSLLELRLQSNQFMGSIPDTLFKSKYLEVIDLRNNNFSGKIMSTIRKRSKLLVLLLRNNSFQSHIPEKICQLSNVGLMDLSHNKFKGVIPSCLGNMSFGRHIYQLSIKSMGQGFTFLPSCEYASHLNYLESNMSILHPAAAIVDILTKNRYEAYQGDILDVMYVLDLSSNQLSGEIPVEIGNLESIRSLNFSNNRLTSSIPDSISKLKDLGSLDLSNNKLDGSIPPQLANLNSLGYFNVSLNNFSGEIPLNGHLLTFGEMSYLGNPHLCGPPTNKSCFPTRASEPSLLKQTNEEEEEGNDVIDMVWFYWTCGAVYISTLLALSAFLCIDSQWSREWFYRVDLSAHHLRRFRRFVCN